MKPVSGKIDRKCLPDLSQLLRNGDLETHPGASRRGACESDGAALTTGLEPGAEEVLAICRTVFETPIGLDDGFAEAGGHSIVIARLAQAACRPQVGRSRCGRCSATAIRHARWRAARGVQAAYRGGNRRRKIRRRPALRATRARQRCCRLDASRILQILFATLLYSPGLLASPRRLERRRNRNLLRDRQHLDLHRRRRRPVPAEPARALRLPALGHDASSSSWGATSTATT